jgi:hypothetical protein
MSVRQTVQSKRHTIHPEVLAMKKKRSPKKVRDKYPPRTKITLPFEKAVEGLLGLSPEDAKAVRARDPKPKKKGN